MGNDYAVLFGALDTIESRSGISIDERFEKLRVDWKRETLYDSLLEIKQQHSIYQQIVGLGSEVIPVLYYRICQGELEWSAALTALTGFDPSDGLEEFTFDTLQVMP